MRVVLEIDAKKIDRIKDDRATFGWVFWRFASSQRPCWISQLFDWYGIKVVEIDGEPQAEVEEGSFQETSDRESL